MGDFISMNDFNAVDDLMEKLACLFLFYSFLRHNEIKHFTTVWTTQDNKANVSTIYDLDIVRGIHTLLRTP